MKRTEKVPPRCEYQQVNPLSENSDLSDALCILIENLYDWKKNEAHWSIYSKRNFKEHELLNLGAEF